MSFLRVWLLGYTRPARFVEAIWERPAPMWGLGAQLLRAALDALGLYLPLALMGRTPPTPSYIAAIPSERYYAALIWISPLALMAVMLLEASYLHVALRLLGRASDFDRLVNLIGMTALVVGALLVPWDWAWVVIGGVDQIWLGVSHLIISLSAIYLVALGLRRKLGVPAPLAALLSLTTMPVGLPIAIMFMRSPL